ncbi:hypothetical protein E2320_013470, partial [Naja naja]
MWFLQSLFHFNRKCLIGSKQPDHMKGTLDRYLGGDLNSGVLSDAVIIVKGTKPEQRITVQLFPVEVSLCLKAYLAKQNPDKFISFSESFA